MDQPARVIKIALAGVLALPVVCLAAALLIPFKVNQSASVRRVSGQVELLRPDDPPQRLDPARDDRAALQVSESLRVAPDSTALIVFDLNQGRATVTGPALLTLAESCRRATALGHIAGRGAREYVLIIEQASGLATYDFSRAHPGFAQTAITVRLPDRDYAPPGPCWHIEVAPDGTSAPRQEDCPR